LIDELARIVGQIEGHGELGLDDGPVKGLGITENDLEFFHLADITSPPES
jgi:hypothetical protein